MYYSEYEHIANRTVYMLLLEYEQNTQTNAVLIQIEFYEAKVLILFLLKNMRRTFKYLT